jgi:hypothetical protein
MNTVRVGDILAAKLVGSEGEKSATFCLISTGHEKQKSSVPITTIMYACRFKDRVNTTVTITIT